MKYACECVTLAWQRGSSHEERIGYCADTVWVCVCVQRGEDKGERNSAAECRCKAPLHSRIRASEQSCGLVWRAPRSGLLFNKEALIKDTHTHSIAHHKSYQCSSSILETSACSEPYTQQPKVVPPIVFFVLFYFFKFLSMISICLGCSWLVTVGGNLQLQLSSAISVQSLQLCWLSGSQLVASSSSFVDSLACTSVKIAGGILCAYAVSSWCGGTEPFKHLWAGKHRDCPANPSGDNWINVRLRRPEPASH